MYFLFHKAKIKFSFYPTSKLTKPNWRTYGLGWFQHDYRGLKIDMHTGSLQGLVAIIAMVRDKNIGLQVFANMDGAELRHALVYKIFDLLLFVCLLADIV